MGLGWILKYERVSTTAIHHHVQPNRKQCRDRFVMAAHDCPPPPTITCHHPQRPKKTMLGSLRDGCPPKNSRGIHFGALKTSTKRSRIKDFPSEKLTTAAIHHHPQPHRKQCRDRSVMAAHHCSPRFTTISQPPTTTKEAMLGLLRNDSPQGS